MAEKHHYAVVKFNTYQNLQRHRAVLLAITRLFFVGATFWHQYLSLYTVLYQVGLNDNYLTILITIDIAVYFCSINKWRQKETKLIIYYRCITLHCVISKASSTLVTIAENGEGSHRNYSPNSITSICCGFVRYTTNPQQLTFTSPIHDVDLPLNHVLITL